MEENTEVNPEVNSEINLEENPEAIQEEHAKETEPKETKRPKWSLLQIFCLSGGIFALIVQTVAVILFALGLFAAFGRNVTIVSAMELILLIFNVNKAVVYRSVFGMLLGLLFYALLALMLKCFGVSAVAAVRLLLRRKVTVSWYGKLREEFPAGNYFRTITGECLLTFEAICIFAVAATAVTETDYGEALITLTVLFGIVALLRALQRRIARKESLISFVFCGLRECMVFTAMVLMIFFLRTSCIKIFIGGCSALFGGNFNTSGMTRIAISSFYSSLIAPALLCAVQVLFLRLFDNYRSGSDTRAVRRKLLILLLVILAFSLVFRCILVSATGSVGLDTFIVWMNTVKSTYLPMVLVMMILLLLYSLYGKGEES